MSNVHSHKHTQSHPHNFCQIVYGFVQPRKKSNKTRPATFAFTPFPKLHIDFEILITQTVNSKQSRRDPVTHLKSFISEKDVK